MKSLKWNNMKVAGMASLVLAQAFLPHIVFAAEPTVPQQAVSTNVNEKATLSESARLLPASEEPEDHRLAREERIRFKKEEAQKKAELERNRLIEERTKNWNDAFPVVAGSYAEANFINSIAKDSVAIARDADLYPSVLIAQAGLESNWGRSGLSQNHHNLFGIKGQFNGQTANLETWEDVNQSHITIVAGFRSYPSDEVSILDYAQLLKNGLTHNANFYRGTWRSETNSYKDVTSFLQGRYATDTQYTNKLNRIIEDYGLARFDEVKELDLNVEVKPEPVKEDSVPEGQYKVKEGDTIQLILHKTGLTYEEFMAQNDLPELRIHVNQIVNVHQSDEQDEAVDNEELLKAHSLFNKKRLPKVRTDAGIDKPSEKVAQKSTFR